MPLTGGAWRARELNRTLNLYRGIIQLESSGIYLRQYTVNQTTQTVSGREKYGI